MWGCRGGGWCTEELGVDVGMEGLSVWPPALAGRIQAAGGRGPNSPRPCQCPSSLAGPTGIKGAASQPLSAENSSQAGWADLVLSETSGTTESSALQTRRDLQLQGL